ncbi:MAG: hypothetical protein V1776_05590 [Candidatus Diapherotrites archaeon]
MYDSNEPSPEEEEKNTPEYESPFESGGYVPNSSPLDRAKEFLQQHGKTIAIVLVLGIIGFFIYDYFLGSLVTVTLEARNTENVIIPLVEGKLYETNGNSSIKTFAGNTTLSLRPGEYRVEWDTGITEYEDLGSISLLVDRANQEGGQTEKTILEKNIPVNITNIDFPSALVVGQNAAVGTVTLENKSTQTQTIELVFEGDLDPKIIGIATQPPIITLNPNAILPVTLSISVPSTSIVKNIKNGDAKKGNVRVKYTKPKKEASYILFKSLSLDVTPKTPQTFKATANKLYTKTFTLRNTSGIDSPEGAIAEALVKSTQNNDIPDIQKWFSFNPTPPFSLLKKSETMPVVLNILAPITAANDTITGEIHIYTGYWSEQIPFTLTIEEAPIGLKVTLDGGIGIKKYTINKDSITGQWEFKNALLKLENTGDLPIENTLLELEGCEAYIKQVDESFFYDLILNENGKTGDAKTTTLQITAPATALPGATQNCLLQVTYLNPKDGEAIQVDPITVQIET